MSKRLGLMGVRALGFKWFGLVRVKWLRGFKGGFTGLSVWGLGFLKKLGVV